VVKALKKISFQAVFFTFTKIVLNTMYRMVYPFLAVLGRGVGVEPLAISNALVIRSLLGTVGPFAATISDLRGRRFGMLLGIGLFVLGSGAVILWPVFPMLVVAIILTTLGKFIYDPSMQAYLGDRIAYERRGRSLALIELSWSLAFIIGVPLMGFLIARQGWLAPFPLFVLLGSILFAGVLLSVPRDGKTGQEKIPYWSNIRLIVGSIPAIASLAIGCFSSAANEMVNLNFGLWLEDSFHLQIASLGAASMVIGFAELGGEGFVAGFVDRLGKPRAIGLGLGANCLSAVLLFLLGRSTIGALVGLFLFYLTFEFTIVSCLPLMTEILPGARATLMAFNLAAQSIGRAVGDLLGPRLYQAGFIFIIIGAVGFNLLASIALHKLKRSMPTV
jgi:predicted MFS family arabinose efflux permease